MDLFVCVSATSVFLLSSSSPYPLFRSTVTRAHFFLRWSSTCIALASAGDGVTDALRAELFPAGAQLQARRSPERIGIGDQR